MLITLGKVLEVLTEENKLRVRTPIFETSGNTAQVILVCSVCHDPGSLNGYKADDTVYVTFTDNDFTRPVVLGKLYLGLENEEGSNFQKANALEVTQSAILPANTKIGDLDFTDISGNLKKVAELDSILSRKQNRLVAGTNITLVDNPNDTTTINASGSGGATIPPERLTFAQNLVVNGNGYQMPNVKFGSEQTYGIYTYREFQNNSTSAPITDTTTIKNYLTIMTGNDAIPVYDADDGKACFIHCSESNTLWKIQRQVGGATNDRLWAFKVVDAPFSLNIKDGTGENSIRQATSVAGGSNSAALGHNTETSANCTFTAGTHTFAGCLAQTAVGKYNTKYTGGNLLFVVGNGSADNDRSDAFKVWTNGTAEIQAVGTGDNAVVNKKYVDDRCITEISTQTIVIWDLADGLYLLTYNGAKTLNYGSGTQQINSIGKVLLQVQSTTGTMRIFQCERDYQSLVYGYVASATTGGCYSMAKLHGVSTCNGGTLKNIYAPETVGSSGQYLKSNGSGAPTWTTPTHSYRHDIMLFDNGRYFCCFNFINNNPVAYTTNAAISAALFALGFIYSAGKFMLAGGPENTNAYRAVAGAQGSNVFYLKSDGTWANSDWTSVSDVVTQIC